jgi:hypothetical protein
MAVRPPSTAARVLERDAERACATDALLEVEVRAQDPRDGGGREAEAAEALSI